MPMLYLIGGAARAGKTILAQRIFHELCAPYFCIDYFVSAIERGAPELGIESEAPNRVKAEKLWPRMEGMLRNIVEVEPQYTVEGDALWPRGTAQLMGEYPGQVRACFLGFTETTPERKLAEIRTHSGSLNDWIQHHSDEYILRFMAEMIEFSRFVQAECSQVGIAYFDVSNYFESRLQAAYAFLTGRLL